MLYLDNFIIIMQKALKNSSTLETKELLQNSQFQQVASHDFLHFIQQTPSRVMYITATKYVDATQTEKKLIREIQNLAIHLPQSIVRR